MIKKWSAFRKTAYDITGRGLLVSNLLVLLCGLVLGTIIFILFVKTVHIPFHRPSVEETGVISWITVNQYPKQQDVFYYYAGIIFLSGFSVLSWLEWIIYSSYLSKRFNLDIKDIASKSAWTFIPILFFLPLIVKKTTIIFLILPLLLVIGAKGLMSLFLFKKYFKN